MKASYLIADRDLRIAEATRRCLCSRGCDARVATNGLQCVDALTHFEPMVVVLDPDILWGGGDGVLEWFISEKGEKESMVVLADSAGSSSIPERLSRWVDVRIKRPESLQDLLEFVKQLETVGSWSTMIERVKADESSLENSREPFARIERE